jgi:hypothetical protein
MHNTVGALELILISIARNRIKTLVNGVFFIAFTFIRYIDNNNISFKAGAVKIKELAGDSDLQASYLLHPD